MRIQFKEKSANELLRLAEFAGQIKFADANAPDKNIVQVQVLRVGAWEHPWYGTMIITPNTLADMIKNFKDNVKRQDLPIDYFHESDKEAAGWVKDLTLSDNGQELWASVQITPKCAQMLADKEIRYFSADFYFDWTDPETGVSYKNVLNGGGFVNRPFVKDMQPITELSEGENMDIVEAKKLLAEKDAKISEHEATVKKLSDESKAKDVEIATLKAEKAEAAKAKELADKEAKFADLCAKGKACAAQKEAYMSGDMVKFAELSQPVNVVTAGETVVVTEAKEVKLSAEEKAACKLLGLTEEEFLKYNK
jgi:phage I-like protein